jgi:hypothetical protein
MKIRGAALVLALSIVDSGVALAQCAMQGASTAVGRRASLATPLVLSSLGDRTAVGWVVPDDLGQRNDDAAAVVLGPDGAVVATLDREEPASGGGQYENPIHRVSPVVRAGAFAVDLDHEENSEPGTTTVVCGSHRDDLVASTDGPGGITLTFRLDATSQCRTLAPEHPLVLGARAELDAQRRPSGTLRLLFGAPGSPTLQRTSWSLPMRGDLGAREYAAVRLLTEQNALEGAQAVWVGDAGWYVVFRFGETLYGGWVSPSLQPVGALAPLTAAPVSTGLPTVATNGREVLVVHAARRSNADRWALVAERVTPRGTASPPLSLAIEPPAGQHHFAPSVAALPAGWALGYSQGLLRGSSRRRQHVWLVALDPQLAPRGAPVQVSDDAGGSDGRIASSGGRVHAVYMAGQGRRRSVRAAVARCQ